MTKAKKHILLGFGGHARQLAEIITESVTIDYVSADVEASSLISFPLISEDHILESFGPDDLILINGIGMISRTSPRLAVSKKFRARGYDFLTIKDPNCHIKKSADIGNGSQIMAGSIIQSNVSLGEDCIINTNSSIDHDAKIFNLVHIGPGATVCADVCIGERTVVGPGATICRGVQIGSNCLIKAGAVISNNISDNSTVDK